MSESTVRPIFGSEHDASARADAVLTIAAELNLLYPLQLYPPEIKSADAQTADRINAAVYNFFNSPADTISPLILAVFEKKRARDILRCVADRAIDYADPATVSQISRLQRLVGAVEDNPELSLQPLAPIEELHPAQ